MKRNIPTTPRVTSIVLVLVLEWIESDLGLLRLREEVDPEEVAIGKG